MHHGFRPLCLVVVLLPWAWVRVAPTLTRGPYLQSTSTSSVTLVCRTSAASPVTLRFGEHVGPPWDYQRSSFGTEHVFELTDLRPETSYAYELASDATVLAQGSRFRTAPPEQSRAPFRFLAWGDSGTGALPQLQLAEEMARLLPAPDFALGLGDLVYPAGDWEDYDPHFFTPYAELLPRTGFWSAIGNHDAGTENGAPYFDAFHLPTTSGAPGQPSGTEHFYSFDHGMAHFTCLDTEESSHAPGSPMYTWLVADLADANARGKRWLVVFMHAPPYTHGTHDSDSEGALDNLRRQLVPVFEANGVDLVLGGHSHVYERSFLARGDAAIQDDLEDYTKLDTSDGTLYVVCGCGGKAGTGDLDHPLMARSYGDVVGCSVLDLTWEELRGSFLQSDGSTTDVFTVHKGEDVTGPRIAALESLGTGGLRIVFDEPVRQGAGPSGVANPANYRLLPATAVLAASPGSDRRSVVLQTASLTLDDAYQLSVLGVADAGGHAGSPRAWFVPASNAAGRPEAVISTRVRTANAPAEIAFSGERSSDGAQPLANMAWDFGDGSAVVTGMNVEHEYDEPGLYTASLVVTDGSGLQAIDRVSIRIHAQGTGPIASPIVETPIVPAGEHASFRSAGSRDPDGGALYFDWDFGDPASGDANHAHVAAPMHAYALAGSYTVVLTVVDDEGSAASESVTVTVEGTSTPGRVFHPVADAMVKSNNPADNYGTDPVLRVRGVVAPEYRSYVRFHVDGLVGDVSSVRLRLNAIDGSDDAGTVYAVPGAWSEDTLTWGNAPLPLAGPLGSFGATASGDWVELDVTSSVTGEGVYSFLLVSESTDSAFYSSREGPFPPELVVTTIDPPPDTTPPSVVERAPAPGATLVDRATSVTVVFDEPVQGVDGASFVLRRGATPVPALVTYDEASRTALLDPAQDLLLETTYTVALTAAITDLAPAPNALVPLSWSFTTAGSQAGPTTFVAVADALVKSSSPSTNYGSDAELRVRAPTPEYRSFVRFDVSGLQGSVGSATLRLFAVDGSTDGGQLFSAGNGWSESTLTWSNAPSISGGALGAAGPITAATWIEYDVTAIVSGDGSIGFALASTSTDSAYYSAREGTNPPELVITTFVPEPDTTPPTLVDRTPAPGATLVPVDAVVQVEFDEPVQGVSATSFLLRRGATPVAASVSYDGASRSATLAPAQDLLADTTYTVALTAAITDLAPAPNALVPSSWSFTTAPAASGELTFTAVADALVKSSSPTLNYGSDSELRARAPVPEYRTFLRFQVDDLPGTVSSARVRLFATRGSIDGGELFSVAGGWSEGSLTWNNAPAIGGAPLAEAGSVATGEWAEYDVSALVDGAGTYDFALTSTSTESLILSSREGASPPELVVALDIPPADTTPPSVVTRHPAADATDVPSGVTLSVVFDEPVQDVDGTTFLLQRSVQTVSCNVSYQPGTRTALLDPTFDLVEGVTYTATLTSGITDLAAVPNALEPLSWSFTTVSSGPATLVVAAQADAQTKSSAPTTNFGADATLRVRAPAPEYRTYLRFDVDGAAAGVVSATLRLYATDPTTDCGTAYLTTSGWSESGLTWNNAPPSTGSPLATPGATTAERWVEFDVTGAVTGAGLWSFVLVSPSIDSAIYSSREGANAPELVLEVGAPSTGPRADAHPYPTGPTRDVR